MAALWLQTRGIIAVSPQRSNCPAWAVKRNNNQACYVHKEQHTWFFFFLPLLCINSEGAFFQAVILT